jgi:hypothetical protein
MSKVLAFEGWLNVGTKFSICGSEKSTSMNIAPANSCDEVSDIFNIQVLQRVRFVHAGQADGYSRRLDRI